jgi:dUTPase
MWKQAAPDDAAKRSFVTIKRTGIKVEALLNGLCGLTPVEARVEQVPVAQPLPGPRIYNPRQHPVVPAYENSAGLDLFVEQETRPFAFGNCVCKPGLNEEGQAYRVTHIQLYYKVPLVPQPDIPDGYFGNLQPRSSAFLAGSDCRSGIIDSGYKGPLYGHVTRTYPLVLDAQPLDMNLYPSIQEGEKLFQLIMQPHVTPMIARFDPVTTWEDWTANSSTASGSRGTGGFGSSDRPAKRSRPTYIPLLADYETDEEMDSEEAKRPCPDVQTVEITRFPPTLPQSLTPPPTLTSFSQSDDDFLQCLLDEAILCEL